MGPFWHTRNETYDRQDSVLACTAGLPTGTRNLAGFKEQVTALPAVAPVWQAWPVSLGPVAVLLHFCLCCLAIGLEQT